MLLAWLLRGGSTEKFSSGPVGEEELMSLFEWLVIGIGVANVTLGVINTLGMSRRKA